MFIGGMSITTAAFLVWVVGYCLHASKDEVPGAGWSFVMMICCAVIALGGVIGLASGNIISAVVVFLGIHGAITYYRIWRDRRGGW
ncbi:MAG: hypothetical protein G01um101419_681 [Parcubacteria group bacterium Gr01-1014_19]|nr:MAG: hypothetical protein G01um101419_681 [Parcubacteria group bacterium Gr01-1014_19]